MPDKLDLSHFKIKQAILEFRYSTAYLLWDRAGLIWNKISSELHNLKMIKAEPATTTFISDDRYELSVKLDKSHFTDMKPCSGLKDFFKYSESFFSLVTNMLDISESTRLGFRLVYVKNFPDKASAAKSLLSTNKLQVPEGKHFNIEGKVLLPRYSFILDGESTAVRISLTAQDKKIDFDVSPEVDEISPVHLEKHELVYDIDYYTSATISKGQLNIGEWLSQAYHLIKRDSKVIFSG